MQALFCPRNFCYEHPVRNALFLMHLKSRKSGCPREMSSSTLDHRIRAVRFSSRAESVRDCCFVRLCNVHNKRGNICVKTRVHFPVFHAHRRYPRKRRASQVRKTLWDGIRVQPCEPACPLRRVAWAVVVAYFLFYYVNGAQTRFPNKAGHRRRVHSGKVHRRALRIIRRLSTVL